MNASQSPKRLPTDGALNGLSHFTVEFYFEPFRNYAGWLGIRLIIWSVWRRAQPASAQIWPPSIYIRLLVRGIVPSQLCTASSDVGGSLVTIIAADHAGADATPGITHHLAVTYDGSTQGCFWTVY